MWAHDIPKIGEGLLHCWGGIRKISDATAQTRAISFKSHEIVL